MTSVSVILNLSSQALAAGRLAGRAEIVTTGEQQLVRDAGELMTFLRERTLADLEGEHDGTTNA